MDKKSFLLLIFGVGCASVSLHAQDTADSDKAKIEKKLAEAKAQLFTTQMIAAEKKSLDILRVAKESE